MATIRDVARAAGVSIATVSRVYNNQDLVNADTAERVLKFAAELDYWPNPTAQSLTTRRTRTFGVLLPDLFGEFYSEVIRGIDLAARRGGYQILLSSSHSNPEDVLMASRAMLGRIDGVIMMAPDETSIDTVARVRDRVPVVLLNPRTPVEGCHSVAVDNFHGAKAAVSHLIGLGHRDVAMITGPEGNGDAEDRLRGFREALADEGLDPDAALVIPGDFRETTGFGAGEVMLGRRPRPTAVFAANDSTAIGLMAALRVAGCRVPEDIAVVGFDNVTIAGYLNPALTTVHVDACGLGGRAVELMMAALESGAQDLPRHQVIQAVLKVRQSCGAQKTPALKRHSADGPAGDDVDIRGETPLRSGGDPS
ncbi:MAG: LacI family DNA-binding transcriptional regulator [bacterium]